MAVNTALMVLSWHENLPRDEQPPREIWWSGELLDEWFKNVEDDRGSRGAKKRSSYDEADDAPMSGNVLTEGLRPDRDD